jgi:hypothetical protein
MRVLRIAMSGEEHPHYTFTNAFLNNFDHVNTIWWDKVFSGQGGNALNNQIQQTVIDGNYDFVFIQIQGDGVISEETAQVIKEHSLGFNWTGDVRTDISWYERFGKYFITSFTNETDVKKMRELGYTSEYLQTGYDDAIYLDNNSERNQNIVFCANYYTGIDFPLTPLRMEIGRTMYGHFKDFKLYGKGWNIPQIRNENTILYGWEEAYVYQHGLIAINCSHFDYERYSSDRLLREMACGCMVLSHKYQGIEIDYKIREHLDTWSDMSELVEKTHYYLSNPEDARRIGKNASEYVKNNCTWNHRMKELKQIILKHKNK